MVISSNDKVTLLEVAHELNVDSFVCDVTSFNNVKALAGYTVNKFGRIDMWINNAGIQIAPSNIEDVDIQKLYKLFEINFFGYFYGCKAVLPILHAQNSGAIVNINSTAGLDGKPELSAYVSSKFAVKGLTLTLREELKGNNIQVYGIHPGGMKTEIYREKYPADFNGYMSVDDAIEKVMSNFAKPQPELDLIIRRQKTESTVRKR